jgi:DNA-binding MarR family transcriptional regulator
MPMRVIVVEKGASMDAQFSLERRLGYRFSVLSAQSVRFVGAVYTRKFGLTIAEWRIMSIIGRYEPIFPGVAAKACTMSADKLTRAVDHLVNKGYVVRNTDEADRRRVILCLTSRGRAVYTEVEALHQQTEAKWREALSADESAALDEILNKLEARAQEIFSAAPGAPSAAAARRAKTRPASPPPLGG